MRLQASAFGEEALRAQTRFDGGQQNLTEMLALQHAGNEQQEAQISQLRRHYDRDRATAFARLDAADRCGWFLIRTEFSTSDVLRHSTNVQPLTSSPLTDG